MTGYRIPAIPTLYRGRRYRSRLEARWAAFFDLLGWHQEYEPADLGSWSPDFALWGRDSRFPTLVEVKPIDRWERGIARKMADACENLGQSILLVGAKPIFGSDFDSIGWWGEIATFEATWDDALLGKTLDGQFDLMPNGNDICPATMFWERLYGLERFDFKPLWAEAANLVQWRGVDATP